MGKKVLINGLSGIAQIMFMNRADIGGVFLLGIFVFSPFMSLTCLAGSIIANYTAIMAKKCPNHIQDGLYGFNGALLGLALPVYLPHNLHLWVFLVIGASLTTLLYDVISSQMGILPLSLPYVLLTWLIIKIMGIEHTPMMEKNMPIWSIPLVGIGQIFFLESILSGIVILAGLSIVSLRYTIWTLFGSWLGVLPILWSSNHFYVSGGLISLNTALYMIAHLHLNLKVSKWFILISTVVISLFYPILYDTLSYFSLPTLTVPFIIFMWIGILVHSLLAKRYEEIEINKIRGH